jgi:GTPase SAR1 family protein
MERLQRVFKPRSTTKNEIELDNSPSSSNGEIVIAIMGETGVGKSSFIEAVTGQKNISGHGLESGNFFSYSELRECLLSSETATVDVKAYRVSYNSVNYVLVDTPGYDDSSRSNEEVTGKILLWLRSSYQDGTRLNGIIYIHSILKPRMQGSVMKNMRIFRKLCGDQALGNVLLATSFWDSVPQSVGDAREAELVNSKDFWAGMIAKGSEVVRIDRKDKAVCLQVMESIAAKSRIELAVQQDPALDIDTRPDEIQQLEEEFEADRQKVKAETQQKLKDSERAGKAAMKEEKKSAKRQKREEKTRRNQADKEYKRSLKEDKRQMRREERDLRETLDPSHPRDTFSTLMLCLYIASWFWNVLITALLGSVSKDVAGETPSQINFCFFVAIAFWLSSILEYFFQRSSLIITFITTISAILTTFLAAVILSAKLGVHSCFNEVRTCFEFCCDGE